MSSPVTNPFGTPQGAARYAAGRPAFHPLVLVRLAPHLTGRDLGADVACGTGLSSVALAELVDRVLAFDVSGAMLAHAQPHPRVTYAQAPAEALPLGDGLLDVLTVAQGFHWFDRDRFLVGARRALKPDGVLALYDDFFLGEMPGREDFRAFVSSYGERYPTPPRHRYEFGQAEAQAAGFSWHEERFRHGLALTRRELVAYLMTHSNTIAATERGDETEGEVRGWLEGQLRPFYGGDEARDLSFGAVLTVLKPR
ncbi:methyltransferase domain-containing protein [Deinococcus sp. MIMF12]|uniref:Methyltransferase domain-containing protein n=1 Tax=Deinococcus rhizophilus TaxID=3049544 RepID=A0ABT7JHW8_9DEIO|nr:class I SAM-dependent methyltransferase [Deinococcus rhizophilus]MDL2344662.1 methyltransferase domain-containing protein [Deinococcus rhizophilus]